MRIIHSVAAMQRLGREWRREGVSVGFVPTMGYLHAGHMRLVDRARQWVGRDGKVVVSIYVNPAQFAPTEDLSRYPRDLPRDRRLCLEQDVDVLFTPSDRDIYRGRDCGTYSTYVVEENLSRILEGASRPTHFRGVTTIVAKLFNIVQPGVAVFGAKDFQQAAIVKRMATDLNFPVKVVVASTKREEDGLAMSSRNKYLDAAQRKEALVLWNSIKVVRQLVAASGKRVKAADARKAAQRVIDQSPSARVDYVEFFHPQTLAPVSLVRRGTQMAMAVFIGKTRLIDNARI